jgi:hypothetical protein
MHSLSKEHRERQVRKLRKEWNKMHTLAAECQERDKLKRYNKEVNKI